MLYHLFRSWAQGEHYVHENPLFRGVSAALLCFVLILWLGPSVIRLLVRLKLGDRPEFYHATLNEMLADKKNVPTMGGVMILAAIVIGTLLLADPLNFYVQMGLVCLVWLGVVGAVDDWTKLTGPKKSRSREGLKSYEKLLFQIGLGVVLGYFVYSYGRTNFAVIGPIDEPQQIEAYRVLMVPFYKPGILLGAGAFMILTVLVVTGTSNAVNLTDGMDGLASGCVALCCVALMLLSYAAGDPQIARKLLIPHVPQSGELAVMCGAMLGSCMAFLWYNCHPAKVFMGDTGSLPLGGLLGFVAVVIREELMLFLVGGIFVLEAISVIVQVGYFKLSGGKRIFKMAPIHHHFYLSGWTESQTVVRFWLLAAVFTLFALATIKLR
ncbi:MAG: phospho-N-acetylmuramoyl-pentapeptide-transferase [Planctomycetes bacterium]|nr:phospho-N-acetylmuramoyl-pentapeptide-transferase [Planctomycetota bacterium]